MKKQHNTEDLLQSIKGVGWSYSLHHLLLWQDTTSLASSYRLYSSDYTSLVYYDSLNVNSVLCLWSEVSVLAEVSQIVLYLSHRRHKVRSDSRMNGLDFGGRGRCDLT